MKPRETIAFLALTLIWGASFLWIKIAVRESGPYTIVTIRLLLALVALLPFVIARRARLPHTRHIWGIVVAQGLMSTAIPWLLITWAETYIDSALATVLNGTVPMFTIVIAHVWLTDDKMTRRRIAGLLIGFAGVVVLMQHDLRVLFTGANIRMHLWAQLAMLLSALFYAVSNVYARAKLRHVTPLAQTFFTMLAADAAMWMVTPFAEAPFTLPAQRITWLAIAWLGVLGAGISYLLFYYLLHAIGPTRVATVTYTIPVVGVTLGVVVLGEPMSASLVAGTLLIVSGVWSVTRK